MARFRAVVDYSASDSEEEQQVAANLQPEPEEASPADDLNAVAVRKGKEKASAPVGEREEGRAKEAEMQVEHQRVRKEHDKHRKRDKGKGKAGSSRQSPPSTHKPHRNATVISYADETGSRPPKVSVMQTSLFRAPEEDSMLSEYSALSDEATSPARIGKHGRDIDGEGQHEEPRKRVSFDEELHLLPRQPSRKYARVEGSASAVYGNESELIDAGLSLGRSFRVGWGPGGVLVYSGALCGPTTKVNTTANTSTVQKCVVPLVSSATAEAAERASKLLSHHLKFTPIESDTNGLPCARPSSVLTFASFAAQFPSTDRSFEASLFRLGHALFDPLDLHLAESVPVDVGKRVEILKRKAALADWLQKYISTSINAAIRNSPGADWAASVFTLLSGNQVERACEMAMDTGNVKVASLIAECPGDATFRSDLRAELDVWREARTDAHMSENTRKIYAILAGIVDKLEGSKGTGIERCPDIQIAKDLSWKQTFGLHLWFGQPVESPVASALESYDAHWKVASSGAAPPMPWYTEPLVRSQQAGHPSWTLSSAAEPPDALYSLIKLYADSSCKLSSILDPRSFSESPVDYRLAWHLYVILARCLRVRDLNGRGHAAGSGSQDTSEGHSANAEILASSYALQLEEAGMIQEAVFVLLHIESSTERVKAIKELLNRCAGKLDQWMARGLEGSLKIPKAWVHEAKAIYALDSGEVYDAYRQYLEAGLYDEAHRLAVSELAPDAVVRGDIDLLKTLVEPFKDRPVSGWLAGGKVYMDYVDVMIRLPESSIGETNLDAAELTQLTRSISILLRQLPDLLHDWSNLNQVVALEEMTRQLTTRLNRINPIAVYRSKVQTPLMDGGSRLRNLRRAAFEKFLTAVEVA
ncbi:uncharacterized protein LAESUDRAFT_737928 [Laetiporus sulphureus 93-53]|uniref:Nuclear pore complex protein NUP96 C-terminal domain-containing protein n=1 Tax=Laetiporus sulphureus 93-53 TaxID=1314785 RepID=A0A165DBT3_9APHY|nr:uncharacterized protein LAESUDRAFT_737928 [Laetiporus sulphureus 93-53]KZT04508.1 hypothetical protein LAESUDRAFT_737928 [Laetiporus sulphureus 93-53]